MFTDPTTAAHWFVIQTIASMLFWQIVPVAVAVAVVLVLFLKFRKGRSA